MRISITTFYLPLFFLMAWIASNRDLSDRLKYRIPLGLRFNCPAIWHFWIWDLFLSSIALPVVVLSSHLTTRFAFSGADQVPLQQALSGLVYPLCFVAIGFSWPKLANITISMGNNRATSAPILNIAALRNRILESVVDRINDSVHTSIEGYVERIIKEIQTRPKNFDQFLRALNLNRQDSEALGENKSEQLRAALFQRAESDFEALYKQMGKVEMIPLYDRPKSLMGVPGMTVEEEEVLYRRGIRSIGRLAVVKTECVRDIAASRVAELRENARLLIMTRIKSGIMLSLVFATLSGLTTGLEKASSYYFRQPPPHVQDLGPSNP
jgi:hypothetical protein